MKDYAKKKDEFVNKLLDKATQWYRKQEKYVHIGNFDKIKKEWSCCNASENEPNAYDEDGGPYGDVGCYKIGSFKDIYHPGRFRSEMYNFVDGWYTCCSQGRYSDGCVKVEVPLFLSDSDSKNDLIISFEHILILYHSIFI
jgi:hypothetical protein